MLEHIFSHTTRAYSKLTSHDVMLTAIVILSRNACFASMQFYTCVFGQILLCMY